MWGAPPASQPSIPSMLRIAASYPQHIGELYQIWQFQGVVFGMPLNHNALSQTLLTRNAALVIKERHGSPSGCKASGDQMGMRTGTTQKGPEAATAPATVCGEHPSTTPLVETLGRQTARNEPQVRKPALRET
jgi:hypothetical protein